MIFLMLWVLAIGCAFIHVSAQQLRRHPYERATVFLLYQLSVSLGLAGLLVFVGHGLRAAETAARIGWPTAPNFQFELGAVGLGMAIGSGLAPFVRFRHYWLGIAVGPSLFMALAGINHLREALAGNLAAYNVGIVVPDLLIPASLAWLLHRSSSSRERKRVKPSASRFEERLRSAADHARPATGLEHRPSRGEGGAA